MLDYFGLEARASADCWGGGNDALARMAGRVVRADLGTGQQRDDSRRGVGITARPVLIHRWFAQGEIPGYAKPPDRRGGSGGVAVRRDEPVGRRQPGVAYVSWRQDITSGGSVVADFVSDANRSSAGGDAATSAAAMDQAAMLGFDAGDGGWNVVAEGP